MEIRLRLEPGAEIISEKIEKGSSLADLLKKYKDAVKYPVYAARIDNKVFGLAKTMEEPCEVVFLDARDTCAKEIYQNSMICLLNAGLKALVPDGRLKIENTLNKGIFFEIQCKRPVTNALIETIEKEMWKMVKEDKSFGDIESGLLVTLPSAGYLNNFDLHKCRKGAVLRIAEDTHPEGIAPYVDNKKLYHAFEIHKQWADKMGVRTCFDLNQKIKSGEIDDIIQISEALQEKNIANLADQIVKAGKRVVLIAGPSSSGKTSFAKRLCTQLWVNGQKPVYMGTDDYYLDHSEIPFGPDGKQNFENLDSIDVELFNTQLKALLAGEEVDLPRYDFNAGKKFFGERKLKLSEGQPMVIEGIHGLNEALTPAIPKSEKFKIYISPLTQIGIDDLTRIPLTDVRKLRRIVRDAKKRGWDARTTIEAWPKVREGEDVNIFPYSDEADAVFNSAVVYELAALKKDAKPMLEVIPEDDECYTEAQRLLKLLSHVDVIEDTKFIANNSILREFIGGSTLA